MAKHFDVVGMVAAGGVLGALGRYAVGLVVPVRPGGFPFATFGINVTGCLLMGVLTVLVAEVWSGHRLLRPFLGTGVLGGYTTFSTYAVEIRGLLQPGSVGLAFTYLAGTLVCAMLAVMIGVWLTRTITEPLKDRPEAS